MLSAELRSSMSSFNSRLYRWMLLAYPRDLRSEFGCEIAQTFDLQFSESWRSKRVWGVTGVWTQVILEFFTIAVAYRVKLVTVPCISTAITATVFSALMATTPPLGQGFLSANKPQPIVVTRFGGESGDLAYVVRTPEAGHDRPALIRVECEPRIGGI